ncbi:phosphatidate cytidylyltransferase [Saprolegnia parasitica CBS 223.65]|uniref:Phosphatidate cytidylyltransferase n=1 Tax=Saprolegnia parasitica (strain CBS 223.65) TaxID=695850 RepID=A0A067D3P6_SAPPC|nr:phosphatidate cytidylyltransferase [Saprolegnia parasitica CBS 223.65]KDO33356.1 phosphatidate cytidylyltransferase [Saprolegnia parasitica CBS 223.65]|eukprot:XP_012196104.1 phosphatidate cytidylyltransferase [Saprolegnia parasitica CBS 223.65]
MHESVVMFLAPWSAIMGLLYLTPLSTYMGASSLTIVFFISAILALQFLVVKRSNYSNVRTTQELHVRRKVQHAGTGVLIVVATFYGSALEAAVILAICALTFYCVSFMRKQSKAVDAIYLQIFGPILRQHEVGHRLPGAFYFLMGSALSFVLYPKFIAQLAVLHLSLGDPCASFFGITLGQHSTKLWNGKTLAGVIGCFLVCLLSSVAFLTTATHDAITDLSTFQQLLLMGMAGIAGAIGEVLNVGCDDNLSMPLFSGLFMTLFYHAILAL